ncbi:HAD family hydrolase [Streptomyces sp. NPDC102364]|uniref:HAD family hydrolase n=1 Tax=Streptomyces sp. NPDC102364 TaxID=3366161 RepID=UPI003801EF70
MQVDLEELDCAADRLHEVFGDARCVLFDFDGPICRLFAMESSRPVADTLRELLKESYADLYGELSVAELTDKDPHVVLRAVQRERPGSPVVAELAAAVARGEAAAASNAPLTEGFDGLAQRLTERGLSLSVVTNNAAEVAYDFLRMHGLAHYFKGNVHGRPADPDLMKPHPFILEQALKGLRCRAAEAVMVGDTNTDVAAARAAGVRFVGYGRNERKETALRAAGASLVLNSYGGLLG